MCTNSTENIPNNKETENSRGSREIFSRLSCFYRFTEQQIPRPAVDKERRKMHYSLGKKKRHTVKNQLMVNNHRGYIIHKANHKKGKRHDYIFIYKRNHPVTP